MALRVPSIANEHYHVYNRGVEKRIVFNNEHDYQRFLILLFLANSQDHFDVKSEFRLKTLPEILENEKTAIVKIHAFSLMPNHYHLLLSPIVDGGIAKFIQKLSTGYTMYFNSLNERTGSLFQGKYKIKHAPNETYTKYLFDYIHLNSVRDEFDLANSTNVNAVINKAENYPWSSLRFYAGIKKGSLAPKVVTNDLFKIFYPTYHDYRNTLTQWRKDDFNKYDGGSTSVIETV